MAIAGFKSGVLVDNKMVIIVWTKREVDVRPYSGCGLVARHRHIE